MFNSSILMVSFFSFLFCELPFAQAREASNLLSVGAGVSSPSINTAMFENPAGLTHNENPKILFSGAAANSNLDPLALGATFLTGNGRVGAGLGFTTTTGNSSAKALSFGLAGEISSISTSLGLAGSYLLDSGITNRAGLNMGVLFNTKGPFRVGAVAYDLTGGINYYGAGLSYEMNANAKLVLDSSFDPSFNGKMLKPGLGISIQDFQMAFGYGLEIDQNATSAIPSGTSLALGYQFGRAAHLQIYYNQLAEYYAGLFFRF